MLIDGEAYLKAFAEAALRARRSIVIVGWDFHSGTRLHLGKRGVPDVLGDFLNFLVLRRRKLGTELTRGLRDPHSMDVGLCVGAVAALLAGIWAVRGWLSGARPAGTAAVRTT